MVLKEGLEPSRYCYHRILSPVRLPFRHFSINGAPPETRTPDPFIKSEMLYHWASGTNWLGRLDSNQRMSESKSDALPLGYNPINGGQKWIWTTESEGGWFTVSCVWPLRYLSINCTYFFNVLYIISYKRDILRILTL